MPKRVGKYEVGKTLGEGTFGKVKYAVNVETGQVVAIKMLDKNRIQQQNMGQQIKKEISIMKMIKHKHVTELKEVLASRSKACPVFPVCGWMDNFLCVCVRTVVLHIALKATK